MVAVAQAVSKMFKNDEQKERRRRARRDVCVNSIDGRCHGNAAPWRHAPSSSVSIIFARRVTRWKSHLTRRTRAGMRTALVSSARDARFLTSTRQPRQFKRFNQSTVRCVFSERELMSSSVRLSVVCRLSSVCNVRAPYSADWNFRQCFYAI